MPSELFAVAVGDGVERIEQRVQAMHSGWVSEYSHRMGQFRDDEQTFALDMGQQCPFGG